MSNSSELIRKLGISLTRQAYVLHSPNSYNELMPSNVFDLANVQLVPKQYIWLQAFYMNKVTLEDEIIEIKTNMSRSGQLWISWPKKSSGVNSDLSDTVVRDIVLSTGLVDIKVVSIDEIWSGLKFVYRRSE